MLTPQEVSEHAFAKASFGGYNMAMVDEFLDVLTADYTTLYKENATLKAKMKVLVDKVEEYRSTEEAMLQQDIRSEQMRLTAAQNATAAYVGKLKELYQHEMDYLNGLSKLSAPAEPVVDQVASAAQDISQSVEKLVAGEAPEEDAEDTVDLGGGAKEKDGGLYAELLELSRSHGPEEAEEPTEPTRRIDFDHLQFGKDYEIK